MWFIVYVLKCYDSVRQKFRLKRGIEKQFPRFPCYFDMLVNV